MSDKCKHLGVNGTCKYYADVEVIEPCIEGPCEFDTTGASELTDMERNKAIEYFKQYETYLGNKISEYLSKSFNSVGEYTEDLTKEKSVYSLAITALRKQSESERKIEKAREYCKTIKNQMLVDACTLGYQGACREILEILEGAE